MVELFAADYPRVLPLLAGIRQRVLPQAICEGVNPGRVFVDQRENPQVALLWSPVGYYFLAGDPAQVGDLTDISTVLTDVFIPASKAAGETSLILIASDSGWKAHLPTLLAGRNVMEIYRRPFTFDPDQLAVQGIWRERVPKGLVMRPLDAALAEQTGVLASWGSIEAFLRDGLGFALLEGDEVASSCHSVFACRSHLEIDVHTADNFRRQGLAVLVVSAFIEACLKRGQEPNWECFWENDASVALATRLGFKAEPDYPVWLWEE